MSRNLAELLREALELPPEGRAALADSLLNSLDTETDPNVEQAWLRYRKPLRLSISTKPEAPKPLMDSSAS
jgi:hypothetical protein